MGKPFSGFRVQGFDRVKWKKESAVSIQPAALVKPMTATQVNNSFVRPEQGRDVGEPLVADAGGGRPAERTSVQAQGCEVLGARSLASDFRLKASRSVKSVPLQTSPVKDLQRLYFRCLLQLQHSPSWVKADCPDPQAQLFAT